MKKMITALMVTLFVLGCSKEKTLSKEEFQKYQKELDSWHAHRIDKVKAPDGWLNLVGLYWLEPGINTFGSAENNNVVFPAGKIAEHAGHFFLQGNTISIHVNKEASITIDGNPVTEQIVYNPDSSKSVVLKSGSLEWNIIKRDTKLGIRLRDQESEILKNFEGVERFPVDPSYRVEAAFASSPDSSRTISITNVLGQTTPQPSPGSLIFNLKGKEHKLDVLQGNDEEFFIVFADATSGKETYGGGRFLYVKKPTGDEPVIVDFNRAYNPPCVFTSYATCPLPPKQNELAIDIKAGEKLYSHNGQSQKASALAN